MVEEMWDIQEIDGHCEVRTGQRPNPWKEEGDEREEEKEDVQAYICVSREWWLNYNSL